MGNGASSEMGDVQSLQEQLATMQRALSQLHDKPQVRATLPHQVVVDGALIDSQAGVRVLVGPVVGRVDLQRARILLEVDKTTLVTCHVSTLDAITGHMVELPSYKQQISCNAGRPSVFQIEKLLPGRDYTFAFSGIRKEDALSRRGGFRTPTLESGALSLRAVAVSVDNVFARECGERDLWTDIKELVAAKEALVVLHLGGQVAMKTMFDEAWRAILRHAASYNETKWDAVEQQAMEILRSAYRSQWTLSTDRRYVLANCSNLMIWSDADIYPEFTTRPEFYIDHQQTTIQMQVTRTVTRCARRLYHEYQRQLWDDKLSECWAREAELVQIAERALSSAAQIFQLSQQIPIGEDDLENQKKRRDIEGARRVEKHVRALKEEKVKVEKQLVSFNQLLAPQRGEEYVWSLGPLTVLMIDLRSARLEPGGSQAAENELLSNLQWEFIENVLENETMRFLVVCSECPLVYDIPYGAATNEKSSSLEDLSRKDTWSANTRIQARLLNILFEWKMQHLNRQFVVLAGATSNGFSAKTCIKDVTLRTDAYQYATGAMITIPSTQQMTCMNGLLHDRFSFEHGQVTFGKKSCLPFAIRELEKEWLRTKFLNMDSRDTELAVVLLGPIVGFVDDKSATIMLELDRSMDIICTALNPLTNESRQFYQHFEARKPRAFYLMHLRPEHLYEISFVNIQHPEDHRASFMTLPIFPTRFDLLAVCNDQHEKLFVTDQVDSNMVTKTLWHTIAEQTTCSSSFPSLQLTVQLGGQFFPDDNPVVQEAIRIAEWSSKHAEAEMSVHADVKEKLRQVYRISWRLPGIRESLAHGSHLMMTNANDRLKGGDDHANSGELLVQQLLQEIHQEYQNMLLPPSKRATCKSRESNPIRHVFGAFGIFVLPVGDYGGSCVHEQTWSLLQSFLATPKMRMLVLVTEEAVIEDSVEDVIEKARFDGRYRQKFTFYHQDLEKLFALLFDWKRSNMNSQMESMDSAKEVVLLAGHGIHSFESVVQELNRPSVTSCIPFDKTESRHPLFIRQLVVGPLQAPIDLKMNASLETIVFSQGTLFGRFAYFHSFSKPKYDSTEDHQSSNPETQQFLHLSWIDVREDAALNLHNATLHSPAGCIVSPTVYELKNDQDASNQFPGKRSLDFLLEHKWKVPSIQPQWLQKLLAQELSEEDLNHNNELLSIIQTKDADLVASFEQSSLENGLVSFRNKKKYLEEFTEAITAFHRTCGPDFRTKCPQVPSSLVIAFTLFIELEQNIAEYENSVVDAAIFENRELNIRIILMMYQRDQTMLEHNQIAPQPEAVETMTRASRNFALVLIFLAVQVEIPHACIHDQLDHRMTSNEQTYSDNHPFLRAQRRRALRTMDEVNFQEYNRDVGETVAANTYKPIRITPYYDNVTVDLLPPRKRDLLTKIISNAIRRFKLTLQVVPVQGNLSAQHGCDTQWLTTPIVCQTIVRNEMCLEMPIPSNHFGATKVCSTCTSTGCATGACTYTSGEGVADTDFLLYIRAANSSYCTGDVLAYATSCQKDQFDRPTFGMANFCPSQLDLDPLMYETQLAVAMHEMTHALGFSSRMFAYMRKPDGTPRTPRDSKGNPPTYLSSTCANGNTASVFVKPAQSTVKFSTERNHVVAKLVTPHVAEFVQAHFNCSSLAGAELESQDSGCLGSHWEERLFEPEYMSPVASFRNIFSGLTLAFFEDSGWYRTNLSMVSRMHFGEKQGCSFAQEKCIDPKTTKSIAPSHFCTSKGVESCSVDATSRSVCGISTGSSIPPYYQYFQKDTTEGATNSFSDFCPINTGFSGGDCTNTDNLSVPKGTTLNILGESYCPTCKCTSTTLRSKDSTSWHVNARRQTGCYAMRCSDNQTVEITLPLSSKTKSATASVICTKPGSQVVVAGFTGVLTCPDPSVVCASQCPNACSGNGMCDFATSTCVCETGWIGSDCATDATILSMVTSSSGRIPMISMLAIAAIVTLATF